MAKFIDRKLDAALARAERLEKALRDCVTVMIAMEDYGELMPGEALVLRAARAALAQPAATGEGECPDCNDGILTRAFAEPHDIPCPTCGGTMRAPPLAPVPSGPREGEKP